MKLMNASVKYAAGKRFTSSKTGRDRQNIVVTLADGREVSKWFDADDHRFTRYRKGEAIQVLVEGKGDDTKITIVEPDEPEPPEAIDVEAHEPAPIVAQPPAAIEQKARKGLTDEQKSATWDLQKRIIRRASVISSCHAQVAANFTNERGELLVHPSDIQKYATAVFISLREDGLLDKAGM